MRLLVESMITNIDTSAYQTLVSSWEWPLPKMMSHLEPARRLAKNHHFVTDLNTYGLAWGRHQWYKDPHPNGFKFRLGVKDAWAVLPGVEILQDSSLFKTSWRRTNTTEVSRESVLYVKERMEAALTDMVGSPQKCLAKLTTASQDELRFGSCDLCNLPLDLWTHHVLVEVRADLGRGRTQHWEELQCPPCKVRQGPLKTVEEILWSLFNDPSFGSKKLFPKSRVEFNLFAEEVFLAILTERSLERACVSFPSLENDASLIVRTTSSRLFAPRTSSRA